MLQDGCNQKAAARTLWKCCKERQPRRVQGRGTGYYIPFMVQALTVDGHPKRWNSGPRKSSIKPKSQSHLFAADLPKKYQSNVHAQVWLEDAGWNFDTPFSFYWFPPAAMRWISPPPWRFPNKMSNFWGIAKIPKEGTKLRCHESNSTHVSLDLYHPNPTVQFIPSLCWADKPAQEINSSQTGTMPDLSSLGSTV